MRVAVIGDLMLDVLVEPLGPLHPGDDTPGEIRLECGGQAANVAAWVKELGGRARLICAQATDDNAARAVEQLAARGVEILGPTVEGRGGVVVSIIESGRQRTLISDPGDTRSLEPRDLSEAWFAGCDWLHVSGYHLFDRRASAAAFRAAELARGHGAQISLDLSYAARLRELGREETRRRVRRLDPQVVFETDEEATALGGPPPAPTCVLKQGAEGCTLITEQGRFPNVPDPGMVIDTTGAGDALAAGFLMANQNDPACAIDAGLAAAARCVATRGAMPGEPVPMQMESR